jgi:hypothetical protein
LRPAAAVALYVAYFNYCWRPRKPGLTSKRAPTPAMAVGLTNRPWTLEELLVEVGVITPNANNKSFHQTIDT